jgi:hypothetical protein
MNVGVMLYVVGMIVSCYHAGESMNLVLLLVGTREDEKMHLVAG